MAKKPMVLAAVISLFVLLMLSGIFFVNFGVANPGPARLMGEIAPDDKTTPPTIQFLSPDSTKVQNEGNVVVSFTVDVGHSETANFMYVQEVSYEADWMNIAYITLYKFNEIGEKKNNNLSTFSATLNLTDVPEGNRTVTVHATAWGKYVKTVIDNSTSYGYLLEYYTFKIASSSSTHFTVDATPPNISVLSVKNGTTDASEVQVSFFVNEPVQNISYVLDEQGNVTVAGNFTLSGLSSGAHSLTVYATDGVGNAGASETIRFTNAAQPTPSSSPTISPSANPRQSPTNEEPQASPQDSQAAALPSEIFYASAGATTAIIGVVGAAVFLRRRQHQA